MPRLQLFADGVPRDVLHAARRAAATGRDTDRCMYFRIRAAEGTPIARSQHLTKNTAHGTADNFCISATINYRAAREFSDVLRAARRAAATGRDTDRCMYFRIRAAEGTPIA
ncbi:MAG: hypothetical protein NTV22_18670, partial [bacterium]|nr:hypothetical protein [bacterium]